MQPDYATTGIAPEDIVLITKYAIIRMVATIIIKHSKRQLRFVMLGKGATHKNLEKGRLKRFGVEKGITIYLLN